MKFNDSTWRKFLLESKEQVIEATEEEIEYLGDLLEMPPSALPFDDFSMASIAWLKPLAPQNLQVFLLT